MVLVVITTSTLLLQSNKSRYNQLLNIDQHVVMLDQLVVMLDQYVVVQADGDNSKNNLIE